MFAITEMLSGLTANHLNAAYEAGIALPLFIFLLRLIGADRNCGPPIITVCLVCRTHSRHKVDETQSKSVKNILIKTNKKQLHVLVHKH